MLRRGKTQSFEILREGFVSLVLVVIPTYVSVSTKSTSSPNSHFVRPVLSLRYKFVQWIVKLSVDFLPDNDITKGT